MSVSVALSVLLEFVAVCFFVMFDYYKISYARPDKLLASPAARCRVYLPFFALLYLFVAR